MKNKLKPVSKAEGDSIALMVLRLVQSIVDETVSVPCGTCAGKGHVLRWHEER